MMPIKSADGVLAVLDDKAANILRIIYYQQIQWKDSVRQVIYVAGEMLCSQKENTVAARLHASFGVISQQLLALSYGYKY